MEDLNDHGFSACSSLLTLMLDFISFDTNTAPDHYWYFCQHAWSTNVYVKAGHMTPLVRSCWLVYQDELRCYSALHSRI